MKTPHKAAPRDHLEAVGKAIFGDAYKSPLARALKVDLRSLQRWVSTDSDLAWDHGVIADLREILAGEHTEAVRDEAELRGVLDDLNTAIKSQRMSKAGGGDEMDGWGTYGLWELPFKAAAPECSTTPAEYAALAGRLRAQLHKEITRARDLENEIAILKKAKRMHFSISAD